MIFRTLVGQKENQPNLTKFCKNCKKKFLIPYLILRTNFSHIRILSLISLHSRPCVKYHGNYKENFWTSVWLSAKLFQCFSILA